MIRDIITTTLAIIGGITLILIVFMWASDKWDKPQEEADD